MWTITFPLLVFLFFSFSIGSGILFLDYGHTLLYNLGVPGFTVLPPYTSFRIGFTGGAVVALPALTMRNIPSDLSEHLQYPLEIVIPLAIVVVGAAQGYVGARIWEGKVYTVIDGQKLPGLLGVGSASLAGAVGALSFVLATGLLFGLVIFLGLVISGCWRYPRHSVSQGPAEVEQNRRGPENWD